VLAILNKGNTNWKDNVYLIFLLFFTAYVVHLHSSFRVLYYTFLIICYYFSKRDHVWLVFVFILVQGPGLLFSKPHDSIISLTSTVHISFAHVFALISYVKYAPLRNRSSSHRFAYLSAPILYYMFFMVLISILYGFDPGSLISMLYVLISISFYPSLVTLIADRKTLYNVVSLLFFANMFLFVWQVHDIIVLKKVFTYLNVVAPHNEIGFSQEGFKIGRLYYAAGVGFIAFFSSLFFLLDKEHTKFSQKFLYIVASISFLSMFLTATRGYITMYLLLLICFLFFNRARAIRFVIISATVIYALAIVFPYFSNQLFLTIERTLTVVNILDGDYTADGTLVRITDRGPRVWNKYLESPIWGFGFSSEGFEFNDDHVGNHTLLLQGGVLGVLIWIFVYIKYIYHLAKRGSGLTHKKQAYFVVAYLLCLFVPHSTSSAVFSFYLSMHMVFFFAFIVKFSEIELRMKHGK